MPSSGFGSSIARWAEASRQEEEVEHEEDVVGAPRHDMREPQREVLPRDGACGRARGTAGRGAADLARPAPRSGGDPLGLLGAVRGDAGEIGGFGGQVDADVEAARAARNGPRGCEEKPARNVRRVPCRPLRARVRGNLVESRGQACLEGGNEASALLGRTQRERP